MSVATYRVSLEGDTLQVGFGDEPGQNDAIVRDAQTALEQLRASGQLTGGPLLKIHGPASLPVAVVLAHAVGHLYEVVGVFDPKLGKYVVAISHGSAHKLGDLID